MMFVCITNIEELIINNELSLEILLHRGTQLSFFFDLGLAGSRRSIVLAHTLVRMLGVCEQVKGEEHELV